MSGRWSTVKLGEVLRHRKEFITIDELAVYKRPRVQLHVQGIVLRDQVPGSIIKTKAQQVCNAGEFLVAEIDAKVGGFGIVPDSLNGSIVSSHYFLYVVDESKLNRRFLDYFIRTPAFREQVDAQGSTNYAAIRPAQVLDYEIPLPPLAEQRQLVTRIDELAEQIHEARALRQEATTEVQVLYSKMMGSCFAKFSDRMVAIGSVFRVSTGGTPSRSNPAYWNGSVRWVSSGEVAFCRIRDTKEKITDLGVHDSNAKIYPPSTVLLAMIGQGKTRGQCAILDCHAATNQNVAGIHVYLTEHSPEYIYWWLFANYQNSRSTETGTAQPALSGERVKQMMIPLPSLAEQRRIAAELVALQAEMDAVKRLQDETATELDALVPAILDRAFNGGL
jgi:type I restriction enzyme S subunit